MWDEEVLMIRVLIARGALVVDTRLNGPDALSEIAIPELEELRFYERAVAERRCGRPHPRGAIEVVPAVARGAK